MKIVDSNGKEIQAGRTADTKYKDLRDYMKSYYEEHGFKAFVDEFNDYLPNKLKKNIKKIQQNSAVENAINKVEDKIFGWHLKSNFNYIGDLDSVYDFICKNSNPEALLKYTSSIVKAISKTPEFAEKFIPEDIRKYSRYLYANDPYNRIKVDGGANGIAHRVMQEMYNNDIVGYERSNFLNFIKEHPESLSGSSSAFSKAFNSSHEGRIHKALQPLLDTHRIQNTLGFVPGKEELSKAIEERLQNVESEETEDEDIYDRLGNQEAFLDVVRKHYNPRGKEAKESFGAKPNAGDWIDMKDMDKPDIFSDVDSLFNYLEENYPDEDLEDQLEDFAEEEPEKASQLEDIVPETAEEAKQVLDDNPRNDEANNEEIKKDIGQAGLGMFGVKQGLLNELSRDDTNEPEEMPETNQIPEASTEEVQEGEPDVEAGDRSVESGGEIKPSGQISDGEWLNFLDSLPQDDFEKLPTLDQQLLRDHYNSQRVLNPDREFVRQLLENTDTNKFNILQGADGDYLANLFTQYLPSATKGTLGGYKRLNENAKKISRTFEDGNTEPEAFEGILRKLESRIPKYTNASMSDEDILNRKDEWANILTDENRRNWKKAHDIPVEEDIFDIIEKSIEENPVEAEQVAEETVGEGNPIEEEAEQAADLSGHDNEVNNAKIEETTPAEQKKFLGMMGKRGLIDWGKVHVYKPGEDPIDWRTEPDIDPRVEENNNYDYQTGVGAPGVVTQKDEDFAGPDELPAPYQAFTNRDPDYVQPGQELVPNSGMAPMENTTYDWYNNIPDDYNHEWKAEVETIPTEEEPEEEQPAGFIKEVADDPEQTALKGVTPRHFNNSMSGSANLPQYNPNRMPGISFGNAFKGGSTLGGLGVSAGRPGNAPSVKQPTKPTISTPASKAPTPKPAETVKATPHQGTGYKQNNGPFSSGGVDKHGNSIIQSYNAKLPNGFANNQADIFAGTISSVGGSTNKSNLRETLLAQLEARIKQLPKDVQEHFGFSTKYKHVEYKDTELKELSNDQIKEIERILEVLGV